MIPPRLRISEAIEDEENRLAREYVADICRAATVSQAQTGEEWTGVPVMHAFTGEQLNNSAVLLATACKQASTDILGFFRRTRNTDLLLRVFIPDIIGAIRWLHARGVVFGDVRWSNMLVAVFRGEMRCCVCDFGSELHRGPSGVWGRRRGRASQRKDWEELESLVSDMPRRFGIRPCVLWSQHLRTVRCFARWSPVAAQPSDRTAPSYDRLRHCAQLAERTHGIGGTTTYHPCRPPLKRSREALFVKILWS